MNAERPVIHVALLLIVRKFSNK